MPDKYWYTQTLESTGTWVVGQLFLKDVLKSHWEKVLMKVSDTAKKSRRLWIKPLSFSGLLTLPGLYVSDIVQMI